LLRLRHISGRLKGRYDRAVLPHSLIAFVSFAIVLLVIPGPAVMYIMARSASQGRTAGLVSVLGILTGGLLHLMAAVFGVSAIIAASPAAMQYIRYAGAAYLLYLGIQKLRSVSAAETDVSIPRLLSLRRTYADGVVVNVLNPKTSLFFLAFLPQFIDPRRGPVMPQMLFLGFLFLFMAFLNDSAYALASSTIASRARTRTVSGRNAMGYLTAAIYAGLAIFAVIEGRHSK
jgi:threonine/homoserine/homoserine lactone efflux protein